MCKKQLSLGEERKRKKGICITLFCVKKVKSYKNKKTGKLIRPLKCSSCRKREWYEKYPEKYLFANLRSNARRRGKEFGLTFPQFKLFLDRENYMSRTRGRTKFSISIDRPNNSRGYFDDNLAAITIQANSWKRNYVDYFRNHEEI